MVSVVEQAKAKQCTCYQCKSVLEYTFLDKVFTIEKDYDGGSERVARITCPVCQYKHAVPLIF